MRSSVLVTGATGNTGRHVVAGLLAEGSEVRALTRDPSRAALPSAADVVAGDVTRAVDVAAAARGARAAYLLWPGTGPAAEEIAHVAAALGEHVPRVVHLSAAVAGDGGVWGAVEQAVRGAVPEWTFLRVTGLAVNVLGWAEQVRLGTVRAPFGSMRRSLVHERDVAAVAVRALLDPGHAGRTYVVSGPESLSQREQVRIIGEETGRPVAWEEQPLEEARAELTAGVGPAFADELLRAWGARAGSPEPVTGDVEAVLGRPPLGFREWVRDHLPDLWPGA